MMSNLIITNTAAVTEMLTKPSVVSTGCFELSMMMVTDH